jgi:hypothetical protein
MSVCLTVFLFVQILFRGFALFCRLSLNKRSDEAVGPGRGLSGADAVYYEFVQGDCHARRLSGLASGNSTSIAAAPTRAAIESTLAARLELLVPVLSGIDSTFDKNILAVRRAFSNFLLVQDDLIRQAQTQKFSVEYRNLHPLSEPNRSNVRLIYSHQPTNAPAIITINAAVSFYHSDSPLLASKFRDVQIAAQLDRKLREIPQFGQATLTLAGYYQWMKEDQLITFAAGSTVPGTGIVLPGTAAKLLGTKGSTGIAQAKIAFPLGNSVKIPLSVTWASRNELIKESSVKGQVGFTLDVDQFFH